MLEAHNVTLSRGGKNLIIDASFLVKKLGWSASTALANLR